MDLKSVLKLSITFKMKSRGIWEDLWIVPNTNSSYSISIEVFGLSKERPILGHHAKAHILKSGRFHVKSGRFHLKSGGFHEILGHSPSAALIKLNSFGWNICFYKVLDGFHMKSGGFHVKSKDHLQGIVTLCFSFWQPCLPCQIHSICQNIDTWTISF